MDKNFDVAVHGIIERFTAELAQLLTAEVERRVAESRRSIEQAAGAIAWKPPAPYGRRPGRLCPVPGCGAPSAGPRNRWFCREHAGKLSVEEQKAMLARVKKEAAEGKLLTKVPSDMVMRVAAKVQRGHRAIDMSCRVAGCPNRSRGPRAGFICDQHRAILGPEEQAQARAEYNARKRTGGASVKSVADVPRKEPVAVPPIVRKAEVKVAEVKEAEVKAQTETKAQTDIKEAESA
jgi:hypothetical protein